MLLLHNSILLYQHLTICTCSHLVLKHSLAYVSKFTCCYPYCSHQLNNYVNKLAEFEDGAFKAVGMGEDPHPPVEGGLEYPADRVDLNGCVDTIACDCKCYPKPMNYITNPYSTGQAPHASVDPISYPDPSAPYPQSTYTNYNGHMYKEYPQEAASRAFSGSAPENRHESGWSYSSQKRVHNMPRGFLFTIFYNN